jgi:hypothetical protein
MKKLIALILISVATPAVAQQPDPVFLQHALASIQAQRNQAMDAAAVSDAKVATLTEDLARANAKLKELEPKKPDDGQAK